MTTKKMTLTNCLFLASLCLLIVGAIISHAVWTSGGSVRIEEVEIIDINGAPLKGIVYIPKGVNAQNPAPGVIVNHGYSSNLDALELDAIELSRRGVVVLAMDGYDHGSSGHPDPLKKPDETTGNYGVYSMLQFFGTLPYVDKTKIGLTGHSMGAENSRGAAKQAFKARQSDPSITVPKAVLLQANSPKLDNEDKSEDPVTTFGINYGVNVGRYDEFAILLWGIPKAADYKNTKAFKAMMGFDTPDNNNFYTYRNGTPLANREQQIAAGKAGQLRIGWIQDNSHSLLCFNRLAAARVVEFFDLSLCDGQLAQKIPYEQQIWPYKTIGGLMVLVGFVMFITCFGLLLLQVPFFKTIVKPEPVSLISIHKKTHWIYYAVFYGVSFLVPLFTFFWANEDRIHASWAGVIAPQMKWPTTNFWNLPLVNGSVLYNLVHGAIMVALFILVYFLLSKPNGGKFESTGLVVSKSTLGKSLLLGACIFVSFYIVLNIMHYFTGMDFGFYKFWIKVMPPDRWGRMAKYFIFFFIYALISGVCLNSLTRINGLKEWQNFTLMMVVSIGGLLVLQIINTQVLYHTGVMWQFYVPGSASAKGGVPVDALAALGIKGGGIPNSFAILNAFGGFFVIPASVIFSRVFYKKTGNVWVGAVLVSLFGTFMSVGATLVGRIL